MCECNEQLHVTKVRKYREQRNHESDLMFTLVLNEIPRARVVFTFGSNEVPRVSVVVVNKKILTP